MTDTLCFIQYDITMSSAAAFEAEYGLVGLFGLSSSNGCENKIQITRFSGYQNTAVLNRSTGDDWLVVLMIWGYDGFICSKTQTSDARFINTASKPLWIICSEAVNHFRVNETLLPQNCVSWTHEPVSI